jgi:hypothetical protein
MTATLDSEQIIRTGPPAGPAILFLLPLFDEANRMRRTVRLAMDQLAQAGIGAVLPDLLGQNESLIATQDVTLDDWKAAVANYIAAMPHPIIIASFRGACLIDATPGLAAAWRCAPSNGANIIRTMLRTRIAADKEAGISSNQDSLIAQAASGPLELAGNYMSSTMLSQLQDAVPLAITPCRTVSINPESEDVDGHISGSPLWLRAEPGEDRDFAKAIADDIIAWGRTCGVI